MDVTSVNMMHLCRVGKAGMACLSHTHLREEQSVMILLSAQKRTICQFASDF